MTFDEAVEHFENNTDISGTDVFLNDVEDTLKELRDEYAPAVEMTKKQYHSFKLWKHHTAGWNMTNCAEWAQDEKITATNAMQAWLHPETIKVVDD